MPASKNLHRTRHSQFIHHPTEPLAKYLIDGERDDAEQAESRATSIMRCRSPPGRMAERLAVVMDGEQTLMAPRTAVACHCGPLRFDLAWRLDARRASLIVRNGVRRAQRAAGGPPKGYRNAFEHGARWAEALALKRRGRGPRPDGSRELSGTVVGTLSTRIISQPRAEKSVPEKQKFGRSKQNAPTSVCYSTWFRKTAESSRPAQCPKASDGPRLWPAC